MLFDVRPIVLEILKNPAIVGFQQPTNNAEYLVHHVAIVAMKRNLEMAPGIKAWHDGGGRIEPHGNLFVPVIDVVWDLIIEGVLRPGDANDPKATFPHFHITKYGREVIKEPNSPHDPDNYIKELRTTVPTLDPIILNYIVES